MSLVNRPTDTQELLSAVARAPVTLLTGPRQAGKSTLARQVIKSPPSAFYDLEDPIDRARLAEPRLALRDTGNTIVIDEAQRMPDLFPILRVLVDQNRRPGRFLILGSASPDLVGLGSESLAGRITFLFMSGFRLSDVGPENIDNLWLRGGLPPSYLAGNPADSNRWRDDYITTFLERDLSNLGFRLPSTMMRRFWTMLAHYHGQRWNAAEIAQSIDVSVSSVRRYIDALTDALVVRQLPPWFANIKKRQVKAPKVYIRDSGLLHRLLGIGGMVELERHPKLGAGWEGMVIEQLLNQYPRGYPSYWGTYGGAELDLRLEAEGKVLGFEIKRTATPSTSKSMHIASADLNLDHLVVVHAGRHRFPLAERITAIGAAELLTAEDPLRDL